MPGTLVVRAETAGFCMGVRLALRKLEALVRQGAAPICTLGPIIHNPQVIERYSRAGVRVVESPEEVPPGSTVVIRAHGVSRQVMDRLRGGGIRVVDATCPKVKRARVLLEAEGNRGRIVLLYGEENHPEVRGLLSYASSGAFVFDSPEKLDAYPLDPDRSYCLAAQTTQDREAFEAIARGLAARRGHDVTVLHTICDATRRRQEDSVRIAREVEFMVVVGGRNSGNTRRLVRVIAAQKTPCLHVETAEELPVDRLKRYRRIGLTAGASTPREVVDEVQDFLETRVLAS